MKVRRSKPLPQEPTRVGSCQVETVPFAGTSPLVTLDDPTAAPERARNAFARLRPPEDMGSHETAAWRGVVAGIARAVRVVPRARQGEGVFRPSVLSERRGDGIREEAMALAREGADPDVIVLVEVILSEVEQAT